VRRTLLATCGVLLVGAAAAVAWTAAGRDRQYRRLIGEGETALAADQSGPAIEAFSGAIALKPGSMLGYLKRGETYHKVGDLKAALRDLKQASELDPGATRPLEQAGDVQRALGRFDRAADRYASYVALDDRSPQVLYKLALARYQNDEPTLAIPPLQRALALNDRFAEGYYLLGLCLEADSRTRDALVALEHAVRLAPGLAPARESLARVCRRVGRREDAIEQLEALAALEPSRPERRLALARAYADADRTDLAVTTLGRAAERFPDSVVIYSTLGEVWLRVAETRSDRVALGKAIEALRNAVLRGGSSSRELALYGRAQLRAGDIAGGQRSLREAATKLPVDPETFRYLAMAEARSDRRRARDALVRYSALASPSAEASREVARQIGAWSISLRDPATAATWLSRAIDPVRPDPALLCDLAEAELGSGRTDAARETVERGLAVAPGNDRLLKLRARLRS
jgi:tetratricopeptide (TPR) repeat protein